MYEFELELDVIKGLKAVVTGKVFYSVEWQDGTISTEHGKTNQRMELVFPIDAKNIEEVDIKDITLLYLKAPHTAEGKCQGEDWEELTNVNAHFNNAIAVPFKAWLVEQVKNHGDVERGIIAHAEAAGPDDPEPDRDDDDHAHPPDGDLGKTWWHEPKGKLC